MCGSELTEPVIALIAAIFGGAGLKVVESLLARSGKREDIARDIRDELRMEVESLRAQVADIEERLTKWKREYYQLYVSFNELLVIAISHGLKDEVKSIQEGVNEILPGE